MKILIDESLPHYLLHMLQGYDVYTVQYMGWGGVKNGTLLRPAESQFDVFLTADKNLRYQQNLDGRTLAIIVFPSNKLSVVKSLETQLKEALDGIEPSQVMGL
jgi:hypothetical protein